MRLEMFMPAVTLIIPCYNEAEGIAQLCAKLAALLERSELQGETEILFVDDGSTDTTAEEIRQRAESLPHRVISHPQNQGLGAALKTGFQHARGEAVVTMDSDCTYDPHQVPALLAALDEGADIVTASPYHPRGEVLGVEPWRLFLSKGLSRFYWLILPVQLHTYTSCFRAYRREVLEDLRAPDDGFLAVTQLLVSGILQGLKTVEIPAVLSTRRFGQSKIRVVRLSLAHLGYMISILTGRGPARDMARLSVDSDPRPRRR